MSRVRIVLILTENWTMRARLDAVMVSEHVVLGPSSGEAGLPENPRDYALPGNQDPATPWPTPLVLLSAMAAAGRDPGELEYGGGMRGTFPGPDGVADLDQALAVLVIGFGSTFVTRARRPASSELSDLTKSTA